MMIQGMGGIVKGRGGGRTEGLQMEQQEFFSWRKRGLAGKYAAV